MCRAGRSDSPSELIAVQAVAGNGAVQRLIDGPGITDDAAEGVGAMFKPAERWDRAIRAAQGNSLTAEQPAAAADYEASQEMRKAAWESQVKAELDVDRSKRLAPAKNSARRRSQPPCRRSSPSASSSLNG